MRHLLWFLPLVVGLAAIRWPRLQGIALLVMLVSGVTYLVMRTRRPTPPASPLRGEETRDYYSVQRDIPPPN